MMAPCDGSGIDSDGNLVISPLIRTQIKSDNLCRDGWFLKSIWHFYALVFFLLSDILKVRKCGFMKTNLIVSSRGQLTLPAEIRKKYGINEGSVLVAEDRNGEIVLKPAAVMEVEYYSDEQINEWVAKDAFQNDRERQALHAKLKKIAK